MDRLHLSGLLAALSNCTRGYLIAVFVGFASVGKALPTHNASVRVVAVSDQPAPGAPSGTVFKEFDRPVINNAGQTAFGVHIASSANSSSDRRGYWFEGSNGLKMAALEGTQPAALKIDYGTPAGANFAFSDAGSLAFQGTLVESSTGKVVGAGIYLATDSGLLTVAETGQVLAGETVKKFTNFRRLTINNYGTVAFSASIGLGGSTFSYDAGFWTVQNGNLNLVARVGDSVPGAPSDHFAALDTAPRINSGGKFAFYDSAWLRTNARGFWEVAVKHIEPPPGVPPGVTYEYLLSPILNDRGDVLFPASLRGNGISHSNDFGYWRFRDGSLLLLVREGDQAPGLPSGVLFDSFTPQTVNTGTLVSADSGDAVFFAKLRGPGINTDNNASIWKYGELGPQMIAQKGTEAPGFAPGTFFSLIGNPIVNNLGQIAFSGTVLNMGGYPDGGTHVGIWAQDRDGNLRLIARDGDTVDIDPGSDLELRTIAGLDLLSTDLQSYAFRGANDRPFAFNNRGQIAIAATFLENGRAVFVSNLLAVPEPAVVLLLSWGMMLLYFQTARWRCGA